MSKIKIKPLFNVKNSKCQWIVQNFPEKYEEMVYVEPFCGPATMLLNKQPSVEEVINDLDKGIVKVLRAVRDECNSLVHDLKHVKFNRDTFNTALNCSKFATDLSETINEFILRQMSRGGLKKKFLLSKKNKSNWDALLSYVPNMSKRLENVYIFNKTANEVINAFNKTNTLVYIDPPEFDKENDHIKLSDLLKSFKGKVIVSSSLNNLYRCLYKPWRCIKKKGSNSIWLNY